MKSIPETLRRFAAGHVGFPGIELIYTSHAHWPLSSRARREGDAEHDCGIPASMAVAVLDSSFNPPTMAHLALSHITLPPSCQHRGTEGSTSLPHNRFEAKLLLLSIKNADKTLKTGDASHSQRLEMMILFANELEHAHDDHGSRNVAVAVCQEPTFVGKSTALRSFIQERIASVSPRYNPQVQLQLHFLLGFDTLERLFAARYYDSDNAMKHALQTFLSPSGDNSRVICARRSAGSSYSQTDSGVLDAAAEFIEAGAVVLVDIGEREQRLSSSEVREEVKSATDGWECKVPMSVADFIKKNSLYKV